MSKKRFEVPVETARNIDDYISELVLFTRKPETEIIELVKSALTNRNAEWQELSSLSPLNFHRANQSSIYCLTKWNAEDNYQNILDYLIYVCKIKTGKILDFGGGTGELSIKLAANYLDVDFLEVPGNTLNFAKWRFKKRFLDITTYTSLNQVGKYDIIICLDVLETLEKPLSHLKKFYQLLNKDGIIIFSIGEVGSDYHPMNLESNRNFLEQIERHCLETGFTDSPFENKFHLKIKQKQ